MSKIKRRMSIEQRDVELKRQKLALPPGSPRPGPNTELGLALRRFTTKPS